uniref:anthranilate synthase component I n=1 Tax=Granulicoccus phenolivorans TaxID=266854 RepID=UPI0004026275
MPGPPGLRIEPDLAGFLESARTQRVIPVAARLYADTETPVSLYHQLAEQRPGTFLFESVEQGITSRYSFVGVRAAATLTVADGQAVWRGQVPVGLPAADGSGGNPLEVLGATIEALRTPHPAGFPPMTSGMVGYLGYDIVRWLEKLPDTTVDDLHLPEIGMMLVADLAIFDHQTGEVWLIANAINQDNSPEHADRAYADAVARVRAMAARLAAPREALTRIDSGAAARPVIRQRSSAEFHQMVREAIEEIRAGEIFQVVPSQRFEIETEVDAFDVYRRLRLLNPSPYMYLLRMDGFEIVGSSPESLVAVKQGRVRTYPIAGTRPRGATPAEDAALEADLLADEKERAEHVMLVDLGRNDLGRVCRPGTVAVEEFMKVGRYSHVMHLEAAVTGVLAEGQTALSATLACFPAGTLSGAPKVRAMEIIDRLEQTRRGTYGGVVGWFDFAGDSDVAIAIRTALLKDGRAYVQAGAGIVADSVPQTEDEEAQNKAAAALRAISAAAGLTPFTGAGATPGAEGAERR